MATVTLDTQRVKAAIKADLEDGLRVVGAQAVSWAADQLRENGSVVTSNLINSLAYSTSEYQSPVLGPARPTKKNNQGKTKGTPLEPAEDPLAVRVGSNVVYAARVEFGFVGTDKLGRYYNQAPKSYLRAAIRKNRAKIERILARRKRG